jgi:hypothetical protein
MPKRPELMSKEAYTKFKRGLYAKEAYTDVKRGLY